ncbi:hypothetical protein, partial [Burkholderia stabilis]
MIRATLQVMSAGEMLCNAIERFALCQWVLFNVRGRDDAHRLPLKIGAFDHPPCIALLRSSHRLRLSRRHQPCVVAKRFAGGR